MKKQPPSPPKRETGSNLPVPQFLPSLLRWLLVKAGWVPTSMKEDYPNVRQDSCLCDSLSNPWTITVKYELLWNTHIYIKHRFFFLPFLLVIYCALQRKIRIISIFPHSYINQDYCLQMTKKGKFLVCSAEKSRSVTGSGRAEAGGQIVPPGHCAPSALSPSLIPWRRRAPSMLSPPLTLDLHFLYSNFRAKRLLYSKSFNKSRVSLS